MFKKESVSELVSITESKILGTGQETESMKWFYEPARAIKNCFREQ